MKRFNSTLNQKTPLKSYTKLKSYTPLKATKSLNKISKKQRVELQKRSKLKRELIAESPKDDRGVPLCSECGKPVDWDFRTCKGGDLSHEKSLAQCGKTEKKNGKLLCRHCHNTKRHNLKEIMH